MNGHANSVARFRVLESVSGRFMFHSEKLDSDDDPLATREGCTAYWTATGHDQIRWRRNEHFLDRTLEVVYGKTE